MHPNQSSPSIAPDTVTSTVRPSTTPVRPGLRSVTPKPAQRRTAVRKGYETNEDQSTMGARLDAGYTDLFFLTVNLIEELYLIVSLRMRARFETPDPSLTVPLPSL